MTVGAVIRPSGREEALADAAGRLAVRRIVDSAWAGGALPIIVVADDEEGAVTAALEGSPARLLAPAGTEPLTYALGARAAFDAVTGTSAVLLWPGRMTWVDPETVTSLIEAHGQAPTSIVRPERSGEAGWPVLVPRSRLGELVNAQDLAEGVASIPVTLLELGDPGAVLGLDTDLADLPDYSGPPEPVAGPPPEWGAAAAEAPEP